MVTLLDNFICILVMAVLLLSIRLQKIKDDKTSSRFSVLAHMVMGFLITDLVCDYLYGKSGHIALAYLVNTLDFLWVDAMIIAFSAYLVTLVGSVDKKWGLIMNPAVLFSYIRIPTILILALCGKLFIIDADGHYHELILAIIPYGMSLAIMLMLILVVLRHRSSFTGEQLGVMLAYLLLPLIGGIIEFFTEYYVFTVVSTTLSVMLIYTVVQSRLIDELRVREQVLEELSSTDLLTRLNNRRAYYKLLSALAPEETVGVVFCDINGLKRTNDSLGHTEGDRLILRFADILLAVFAPTQVFRISGDEFVVLLPGIEEEALRQKAAALQKLLDENDGIAAFGTACGVGGQAEQLIASAEGEMYERKREYHRLNPAFKRV